jgi:imidazolonepropionase-like amidohydrolase
MKKCLIKNARLIDGTGGEPKARVDIEIHDEYIEKIHETSVAEQSFFDKVLDAAGKTVMPGIINCHGHLGMNEGPRAPQELSETGPHEALLMAVGNAEKVLKGGVTTTQNVGHRDEGIIYLRNAINKGLFKGPRILCSGQALKMTGGHGKAAKIADGVDEIVKAVRGNIAKGADIVVVAASAGCNYIPGTNQDIPEYELEEMKAAFREAKKRQMRCHAYCHFNTGTINAIKAGADVVHHCHIVSEDTLDLMADNNVYMVPTLTPYYHIGTIGREHGLPENMCEITKEITKNKFQILKKAREKGVKVAFGTDMGAILCPHGEVVTEAKLMEKGGFTPMDIIKSMTTVAAEALGLEKEIGVLAPGKKADLIVLRGYPLENLDALSQVEAVMRDGRIIEWC